MWSGLPPSLALACLSVPTLPHITLSVLCLLGKLAALTVSRNPDADDERGIAGPLLVSYGFAFGTEMNGTGLASYITISDEFSNAGHPSPRYWLLWPGITCMIAVSLTGM